MRSCLRTAKAGATAACLAEHLRGARQITVSDPHVRLFFQVAEPDGVPANWLHDLVPEGDRGSPCCI
ncbi:MAG: hypothetical protein MZV65_25360 [Chromatiales bacterium]|nr:hypothetical protein [Chromatiales bacterium]